MKIIFLAPGLSGAQRGYERFVLELARELRKAGFEATCWGITPGENIQSIPVPGRAELQTAALTALRSDARFSTLGVTALHDWAMYTEDQLFAIPAAARINELLTQGEQVIVYAKWQGGLVDASGAPTELLKVLAAGTAAGRAKLVVHTDYLHAPIISLLAAAGAAFHCIGPWIAEQLPHLGIVANELIELPMSIDAQSYRYAGTQREQTRAELGIPASACVILSVGSFDSTTPDKRHAHILHEILALPDARQIWWVVVGSRGSAETRWEQDARSGLGSRFMPLLNVPFAEMPRFYAMADLFALGSSNETFGLAYIEAQLSGLPVIAHDSRVTRHLCQGLAPTYLAITLVDMHRAGPAAAALSRWRTLLSGEQRETTSELLNQFAAAQEQRFSWEFTGPRYGDAFRRLAEFQQKMNDAERPVKSPGDTFGATWDERSHRQAIQLFGEGKLSEALALLGRAIGARESAERWNDWATLQSALNNPLEAEQGFRQALALDPRHIQAAANLGAVLVAMGRKGEAGPYLAQAKNGIDPAQRDALAKLIETCGSAGATSAQLDTVALRELVAEVDIDTEGDAVSEDEMIRYCTAVLNAIPAATAAERVLCLGRLANYVAAGLIKFRGFREVQWAASKSAGTARRGGGNSLRVTMNDEEPTFNWTDSTAIWPHEACAFEIVIVTQALAGTGDPMSLLAEANRVLVPGGMLFLTAPNIASVKSVHAVLGGHSPYVNGRMVMGDSGPTLLDRREFTTEEIEALAQAAGFAVTQLRSANIFWEPVDKVYASLSANGYPIGTRGDTILFCGQKIAEVRDRFPVKLYDQRSEEGWINSADEPLQITNERLRILLIYENPLRPDRGGEDHRLVQVVRQLRMQGHSVTFLSPRSFEKEKYVHILRDLGIEAFTDDAEVLRREGVDIVPRWTLQGVLREGQFDLALIPLWFWMCVSLPEHYLDEIRRHSPETRIAVINDDCHGLRELNSAKLSQLFSDEERAADHIEREAEILRAADFALAISQVDCDRLRKRAPEIAIDLLPMTVTPGMPGGDFDARDGIMYLADYSNPASRDGIEWYLHSVAPLVKRSLPEIKVYLVGVGLPPGFGADDASVVCVGFAPDLAVELSQRRILISPVRYGTGIKTKNLHAMSHGVPIVTTAMGGEGMDLRDGETALIAETAEDFARAVVHLYTDRTLWQKISTQGRAHILRQFSEERLAEQLRKLAGKVRETKPKRSHPNHQWSTRRVEKYFPEVTTHYPPQERLALRVLAYIRSAEQLIVAGDRSEARRQLRHVFSFVPNRISHEQLFTGFLPMVENMERAYRDLGDASAAARLRREVRSYVPWAWPEQAQMPPRTDASTRHYSKKKSQIDITVAIPTFNRSGILEQCLSALSRQTFPRRRFEVIVVDDGSTDPTPSVCDGFATQFDLRYLAQENAGAGAARKAAVERARGEYVLLFNDDTIASSDLLTRHWEAHREHWEEKVAVLGDFCYPEAAKKRALTHFLSTEPFLFPQVNLEPGVHSKNAFFVACNLSVRRDVLLAAGNFDPRFRIAEDTEIGIRLRKRGYSVRYVPAASAVHQHLDFTIADLIRRATAYGRNQLLLFETHPQLLGDGSGPFGKLDEAALRSVQAFLALHASEMPAAVESLAKFDALDFVPFFSKTAGTRTAADEVMDLFKRALPIVFWYHLFAGFLEKWHEREAQGPVSRLEPVLRN